MPFDRSFGRIGEVLVLRFRLCITRYPFVLLLLFFLQPTPVTLHPALPFLRIR